MLADFTQKNQSLAGLCAKGGLLSVFIPTSQMDEDILKDASSSTCKVVRNIAPSEEAAHREPVKKILSGVSLMEIE